MTDIERALDWRPRFDPRSVAHRISATVPNLSVRNCLWHRDTWLDQGAEGACVGFACAHSLATTPRRRTPTTQSEAFTFYRQAQRFDQWPGEAYEGSSVLGGMQALLDDGLVRRYRWALTMPELLHAVSYVAPVVIGVNWYEGMFEPDEQGYLRREGYLAGGHALVVGGISLARQALFLFNSWGRSWGLDGGAWITFADMATLMAEDGEFAVPTKVDPTP